MSHQEINRMVSELIWLGLDDVTIGCLVQAAINELPLYEAGQ